jgi:hypothetical protein
MSKIIQKLNRLKNPESFFQINTIKGFKYIDKAGEIVNEYHDGDKIPPFSMDLNGLIIEKPKGKIEVLKITPQAIWAKFKEIDSLDMISRTFSQESEKILQILEVKNLSRIGWRNFFIYEFADEKKQSEYFEKLTSLRDLKLSAAILEIKTEKNFKANLSIQPVIKNDEQKTAGVLFDVDIFQIDNLAVENIQDVLNSFKQYIQDENGFVRILNETFL